MVFIQPPDQRQPFSSDRERRVWERLSRLVGPGTADFFWSAASLINDPQVLPAAAHLVAHAAREIEANLRAVLMTTTSGPTVNESGRIHLPQVESILSGLGIDPSSYEAALWFEIIGKDGGPGLSKRAHRNSLRWSLPIDIEFREFWNRFVLMLDAVLGCFEARFLDFRSVVDGLPLEGSPTKKNIKELSKRVPHSPPAPRYFFESLKSPHWLVPLSKAGYFSNPVGPIRYPEDSGYRAVPWPQTEYLKRMAPLDAKIVARIVLVVPESHNISVHAGLAEVVLEIDLNELDADTRAALAARAVEWFRDEVAEGLAGVLSILPRQLARLARLLAKLGDESSALDVVKEVLAVKRAQEVIPPVSGLEKSLNAEETEPLVLNRPETPISEYEYSEITSSLIDDFAHYTDMGSLRLFGDLLTDAISARVTSDSAIARDLSHIFYPDVSQNVPSGQGYRAVEAALIQAVRDTALKIVLDHSDVAGEVILELDSRGLDVFSRIALFVLTQEFDSLEASAIEAIVNRENFKNPVLDAEYSQLVKRGYASLEQGQREEFLEWIDEGPDLDLDGSEGEDSVERWKSTWRRDRLAMLRGQLSPARSSELVDLEAALGEAKELGQPRVRMTTSWGETSPKSAEEMLAMPVQELIQFLSNWEPTDDIFGDTPHGLVTEVKKLGQQEPFHLDSEQLLRLQPEFIQGMIEGIESHAKESSCVDWNRLIPVFTSLTRHLIAAKQVADDEWGEPERRTLIAVGTSLTYGLTRDGEARIPEDGRDSIWSILRDLTEVEDPSFHPTEEDLAARGEYPFEWLNTVRPVAIQAVFAYSYWVHQVKARGDSPSFELVPEIRDVIESHLDPSRDAAPAIREVVGKSLPQLGALDLDWTVRFSHQIFLENGRLGPGWDSYLRYSKPTHRTFRAARDYYRLMIDSLDPSADLDSDDGQLVRSLTTHLMSMYLSDLEGLEERDSLVAMFFLKAGDRMSATAIDTFNIPFQAKGTDGDQSMSAKLARLWKSRLLSAEADSGVASHSLELAALARFVESSEFRDPESLERLKRTLEAGGASGLRNGHDQLLEALEEISEEHAAIAVECASLIILADSDGWRVIGGQENIRNLLTNAIETNDASTVSLAHAMINRLSSLGHPYFDDLVQ